ncbi:unnamed protein product [Didymodactylos carnosus]|uniref:Uncharacterized protein n=1 Tax=Didymodactylos carnosus TaxID=1234261 RepID=A0A814PYG5_9BILA|nr:unnamed protein product [Didymodactylos carnosus]CAF3876920.1 unnamed protein product [Didymodactylos carnosus]
MAAVSTDDMMNFNGTGQSGTGGDVEIRKALTSMQLRNEQFRNLYEQLKKEYQTLTDSYNDCQQTLIKATDENRLMQEKFKNLLDKLQTENRKKQMQIEEMKTQILDSTKLDAIRDRLSIEIEGPYKLAINQLEQQLEQYQRNETKTKYDFTLLQKEYDNLHNQNEQILQELRLKHDKELSILKKERDLLQQRFKQENTQDLNREHQVQRESQQMKLKIQTLLTEIHELKELKDHAELQSQAIQREQLKHLSETKANTGLTESERDSLRLQLSNVHKELTSTSEQLASTVKKLHEVELKQTLTLTEYNDYKHRFKLEIANHKIDIAKQYGDHIQREEHFNLEIQNLNEKIMILESDKAKLQLNLQEKERLSLATIQATREEEWKKISEITNEKLDMEAQVQILSKTVDDRANKFQLEKDRYDEQIRGLERSRDELQKENQHLKMAVENSDEYKTQLEREQEKTRDLYRKCSKLESELASTNGMEQELTDMNMKLKNELSHLINEIQMGKNEIHQMNTQCNNAIANARNLYVSERNELQLRIDDLQTKLKQIKTKMYESQRNKKQRRVRFQLYTQRLMEKTQLVDAKLSEIKEKEQSLQHAGVSLETHNRVKRQLAQLYGKHRHFQTLLQDNNAVVRPVAIGSYTFCGVTSTAPNIVTTIPNDHYDLNSMFSRLDRLSGEQHQQLCEFVETDHKPPALTFSTSNGTKHQRRIKPSTKHADNIQSIKPKSPIIQKNNELNTNQSILDELNAILSPIGNEKKTNPPVISTNDKPKSTSDNNLFSDWRNLVQPTTTTTSNGRKIKSPPPLLITDDKPKSNIGNDLFSDWKMLIDPATTDKVTSSKDNSMRNEKKVVQEKRESPISVSIYYESSTSHEKKSSKNQQQTQQNSPFRKNHNVISTISTADDDRSSHNGTKRSPITAETGKHDHYFKPISERQKTPSPLSLTVSDKKPSENNEQSKNHNAQSLSTSSSSVSIGKRVTTKTAPTSTILTEKKSEATKAKATDDDDGWLDAAFGLGKHRKTGSSTSSSSSNSINDEKKKKQAVTLKSTSSNQKLSKSKQDTEKDAVESVKEEYSTSFNTDNEDNDDFT